MIRELRDQLVVVRSAAGQLLEEAAFHRHDRTGVWILEFAFSKTVDDEVICFPLVQPGFPGIERIPVADRHFIAGIPDEIDRIVVFAFEVFERDIGSVVRVLEGGTGRQGLDEIAGGEASVVEEEQGQAGQPCKGIQGN
jgi:hypothetical protein